jgi:hypothetical protein
MASDMGWFAAKPSSALGMLSVGTKALLMKVRGQSSALICQAASTLPARRPSTASNHEKAYVRPAHLVDFERQRPVLELWDSRYCGRIGESDVKTLTAELGLEFGWCVTGDDASLVDDGDRVGELVGFLYPTTSGPAMVTVPLSGFRSVLRILIAVVLPAPLGPSSARTVPS